MSPPYSLCAKLIALGPEFGVKSNDRVALYFVLHVRELRVSLFCAGSDKMSASYWQRATKFPINTVHAVSSE